MFTNTIKFSMYFKEENEFLTWDDGEITPTSNQKFLQWGEYLKMMRRIAWEVDIVEELDYKRAEYD